jgi:hypothetical protein
MRTREELERLFGGPDALLRVEAHVREANDAMPPLTPRQRDALAVLLTRRIPPRPAPALPDRIPPRPPKVAPLAPTAPPVPVRRLPRRQTRSPDTTTAAPAPTGTAA